MGTVTYIGIDFFVACSKRTIFVQKDATESRAFVQFLLVIITLIVRGWWFHITPANTKTSSGNLTVFPVKIKTSYQKAKNEAQFNLSFQKLKMENPQKNSIQM